MQSSDITTALKQLAVDTETKHEANAATSVVFDCQEKGGFRLTWDGHLNRPEKQGAKTGQSAATVHARTGQNWDRAPTQANRAVSSNAQADGNSPRGNCSACTRRPHTKCQDPRQTVCRVSAVASKRHCAGTALHGRQRVGRNPGATGQGSHSHHWRTKRGRNGEGPAGTLPGGGKKKQENAPGSDVRVDVTVVQRRNIGHRSKKLRQCNRLRTPEAKKIGKDRRSNVGQVWLWRKRAQREHISPCLS